MPSDVNTKQASRPPLMGAKRLAFVLAKNLQGNFTFPGLLCTIVKCDPGVEPYALPPSLSGLEKPRIARGFSCRKKRTSYSRLDSGPLRSEKFFVLSA